MRLEPRLNTPEVTVWVHGGEIGLSHAEIWQQLRGESTVSSLRDVHVGGGLYRDFHT